MRSSCMSATDERTWLRETLAALEREAARSADTHLLHLEFPGFPGKHRLARSLYLYALCNGRLCEGQDVVDASWQVAPT